MTTPTCKQPSKEAFEKWFNTLPHDLASVVKETPRDLAEKAFAAGADSERAKARLEQLIEARRVMGTGVENFMRWLAMRIEVEQAADRKEQP